MKAFRVFVFLLFILFHIKNVSAGILNHVTDPCIRELIDSSIYGHATNEISTLVRDFYGVNDSINLTIDQVYDLECSVGAITDGYYRPDGALEIHISLNANIMHTASREYILATLYHEFLHAILFRKGVKNGQQHEPMAVVYRTVLAQILLRHFPAMSADDAEMLAWVGLQDTVVWRSLSAPVREPIIQANVAYRDGQMGSKCN